MLKDKRLMNFLYWIVAGIFIFLFIFLLVKLFPFYGTVFSFLWKLLSPFFISALIAYLLYPVVKKLQSWRIPKTIAILLIYVLFFGGAAYLIYRVYPAIIQQLRDLNEQFPQVMTKYQVLVYQLYDHTAFLPESVHDKMDELIREMEMKLDKLLGKLVGGFTKIFDMVVLITIIPVLVFYFLKDFKKMGRYVKSHIPKKYRESCSDLVYAINESLGNYIRGQLLVSFFVSLSTFIAFHFLHVNYALLLAIIMGFTNIIPYFGPLIGAIPAIIIAMTVSIKLAIYVIIVIFIIQLIEGNLLSPYIVGKSIAIHPAAIIFVLLLGAEIYGVIGMIVAVPMLTIIKVIVAHIRCTKSFL